MLLLLPPSETKQPGGTGRSLRVGELSFPELGAERRRVLDSLGALSHDEEAAAKALKLGPRLIPELAHNRALEQSPTMPAIARYTGVLFDGIDAASLDGEDLAFASSHVAIQSALFGLISAGDMIPAYRLSASSRLPDVKLAALWPNAVAPVLRRSGLVLDARSEAYRELGPIPDDTSSYFLRVVSEGDDGRRRALNHFNKKAKGQLARRIIRDRVSPADLDGLLAWSRSAGVRLERSPDDAGELLLVV